MIQIMLIEDEEIIRSGLRMLIEDVITGYNVCYEASDGVDALNNLDYADPDIIITDIRMGRMNGIEMIKHIREKNEKVPIIIISGYDNFNYAKNALKNGVSDYILKPVDRIELMEALEQASKQINQKPDSVLVNSDEKHIIRQVKNIIGQRLNEEVSLSIVAEQVHINHQYLSVLFKNETGISFSRYVMMLRMDKAKRLLQETNLKVFEIANLCGYISTKHFTCVFKQFTGMTPSEFKNM